MNGSTDARGAVQDLLQFHFGRFHFSRHFGRHTWLPWLLAAVIPVGAIVVLRYRILSVPPGGVYFYDFRMGLAYTAVVCWAVATVSAYAGGFIMGRLYVPRSAE